VSRTKVASCSGVLQTEFYCFVSAAGSEGSRGDSDFDDEFALLLLMMMCSLVSDPHEPLVGSWWLPFISDGPLLYSLCCIHHQQRTELKAQVMTGRDETTRNSHRRSSCSTFKADHILAPVDHDIISGNPSSACWYGDELAASVASCKATMDVNMQGLKGLGSSPVPCLASPN
jgi:hypothetical protein